MTYRAGIDERLLPGVPQGGGAMTLSRRDQVSMEHELKTAQPYFSDLQRGLKTFELRRDDRGYAVGDILVLREYARCGFADSAPVRKRITYVLRDAPQFGLLDGFVILGLGEP